VSRIFEIGSHWERPNTQTRSVRAADPRPLRVVSVSSNKGGVGKTSIATNLAVYLRALREDLPILLLGFDEQPMIDRMFAIDPDARRATTADALRRGSFDSFIELGQYGVHFVPSSPDMFELKGFETWVPNLLLSLTLAKSYIARGMEAKEPAKAMEDYRRAIRLKPKHLPYHRGLALLLERRRRTSDALKSWDSVLKLAKAGNLRAARREARSHPERRIQWGPAHRSRGRRGRAASRHSTER